MPDWPGSFPLLASTLTDMGVAAPLIGGPVRQTSTRDIATRRSIKTNLGTNGDT